MNDEERLRLRLQQIMAGMQNPYQSTPITMESQVEAQLQHLDPSNMPRMSTWREDNAARAARSTAGERAALEQQMQYANMLRGTPSAQGKRVGPSNIYVENPWEGAEVGLNRALGGYLAGKANRRAAELDETDSDTLEAQGVMEDIRTEEDRGYKTAEREAGQAFDAEQKGLDRALEKELANLRISATTAENSARSTNEPKRFVHPTSGDERYLSWDKKASKWWDAMSQRYLDPDEIKGWTEEEAMNENQREASVAKFVERNGDLLQLIHDIEAADATFSKMNPDGDDDMSFNWFTKQTGFAGDVFRQIADMGVDGNPTAEAYSSAQTVFNAISRMRAGLSQTVNEIERIRDETGQNFAVSPDVMIHYWDELKDKVYADLRRAEDTMSPRTMQALNRWRNQKQSMGIENPITEEMSPERKTRSGRGIGGGGKEVGTIPMPKGLPSNIQEAWPYMDDEDRRLFLK